MSARLGAALVEYVRAMGSGSKFVLIEGVSAELAESIAGAWSGGSLPALAVASADPARFGGAALAGASGTSLRNRHPGGVCIVVCEGQQLPDRQSLRSFENVAPSELLADVEPLMLLARAVREVPMDGPARAVRQAIVTARGEDRPAVAAVARYFDALADGADPLRSLPILGAFADHAHGGRVDAPRVAENLRLSGRRQAEDILAPTATAAARQRARRVLARRMTAAEADRQAGTLLRLLQSGDDSLLDLITFDEAKEILDRAAPDLAEDVERQLLDYRRVKTDAGQADVLPWEHYLSRARALRRVADRRDAARELVEVDNLEGRAIFEPPTRAKLERLLRDRVIGAGNCPEAGVVRGALALASPLSAIEVLSPDPPGAGRTRTAAQEALVLASARLRLGGLMRRLGDAGVAIDGLLLTEPAEGLWEEVFEDADAPGRTLPALSLRFEGADSERVQVNWSPDLDDIAVLRQAILFAEEPSLALATGARPTLAGVCAGAPPRAIAASERLAGLGGALRDLARAALRSALSPDSLERWALAWAQAVEGERSARRTEALEELALAGGVAGAGAVGLGAFSPPKSEWLAAYMRALWDLAARAAAGAGRDEPLEATAGGIQRSTASQQPAFVRVSTSDRALLPISEGRLWSVYGSGAGGDEGGYSAEALGAVIEKLLRIQPEAAGHLRCVAWGPGAADLLLDRAAKMVTGGGSQPVREVEIFCAGHRPSEASLAAADDALQTNGREGLTIRYLPSLEDAAARLARGTEEPAVHLAVATGLSVGGDRLRLDVQEVPEPELDEEVLFCPRTSVRAHRAGRVLLMPPAATRAGLSWLRLVSAMDDGWPEDDGQLRIPELRLGALDLAPDLRRLHDIALWVATIDRYATRDSLERALGQDIAILHQERRLSGESPTSLVISQKSGGPADRAIGRSLRSAGIIEEAAAAFRYGRAIRRVASQGYGILALEAATSGAGINELLGHVVAFSLLATTTTPWPLPTGCRVLLVGLDDYKAWFPTGKRADLLAIAIDPEENGVHVAAIEVKARRSDPALAQSEALDQLRQTLAVTRWAAYPVAGSVHSRLWLNRIAEAAYSVVRESRLKLSPEELGALEQFRRGRGTLEWAGLGLVFGPAIQEAPPRHYHQPVNGDRVPIVVHSVRLSEEVIREATDTELGELYTAEAERPPLSGGRVKRRPEAGQGRRARNDGPEEEPPDDGGGPTEPPPPEPGPPPSAEQREAPADQGAPEFAPPVIGWDLVSGEEVRWSAAGEGGARLGNGHVEIWGSSGAGKTQFTMSLLAQLARSSGTRFGIADFKNDYGGSFPRQSGAEFLDLWDEGAPYNPLALADLERRTVERAVIELRDTVEVAARTFTRMGHRQLVKLRGVLDQAYEIGQRERRWPTLLTLNDLLDDDLSGVIGDLTRSEIFRDGPPLGDVVDRNVIFGFSHIPGNGLTTVLAAGFVLSALLLKVQGMPPVANTIRYCLVVDEAHRVAAFKAIDTMVREGRSKGLSVILATQQPGDLPEVVATNAATKACFRLPDATIAAAAARRLDPSDSSLPEQIRTLGVGEAFVSLGGGPPKLLRVPQLHRDWERLGLVGPE